jgi:hypothetical protein
MTDMMRRRLSTFFGVLAAAAFFVMVGASPRGTAPVYVPVIALVVGVVSAAAAVVIDRRRRG